jgi:hypothetical protein
MRRREERARTVLSSAEMTDDTNTATKPSRAVSRLTEIGNEAMRAALLNELIRTGWNLTETAATLRLDGPGNVARVARHLGLGDDLQRARDEGRVRRGRRKRTG